MVYIYKFALFQIKTPFSTWTESYSLGPFSISSLELSQLVAKSFSHPSNLLQTRVQSCVQASNLGEILT